MQHIIKTSHSKSTASILRYTESLRQTRQHNVAHDMKIGATLVGTLSDRDILCIGLGLYWGEGYKQGSQEFGFTNSDPGMISFYIKWLQVIFKVELRDLILRVSINESHKNRIDEVEKFWSDKTKVSSNQFTKPSFIKTVSKKIYVNSATHYGTLRIKVRRGTSRRRNVLGAIDVLRTV